jgi:hypothetical protein
MDGITPEARGFVSLIDILRENFVHWDRHGGRCPNWGEGVPNLATRAIVAARKSTLWFCAAQAQFNAFKLA